MAGSPVQLDIYRTALGMRRFEHAAAGRQVAEAIVVRLELADGAVGWGETLPHEYVTGAADGPGWPVRNAFQAKFAGTNDRRWGNGDCILARFRRTTRAKQGAAADVNGPPR